MLISKYSTITILFSLLFNLSLGYILSVFFRLNQNIQISCNFWWAIKNNVLHILTLLT